VLNTKNIKSTGGKKAPLLPPAMYPSRIAQILDLGIQERSPYNGTPKSPCNQMWVTYELVDEFMPDDDGNEDKEKPRWISERLNVFSMDVENAKSTKRMLSIDPAGAFDGDWSRVLDLPVLLQIVNRESKGIMYENVGGVTPTMKGQVVAELVNPPKLFDFDNPSQEVFDSLPDFLKDIINKGVDDNGYPVNFAVRHTAIVEDDEAPF